MDRQQAIGNWDLGSRMADFGSGILPGGGKVLRDWRLEAENQSVQASNLQHLFKPSTTKDRQLIEGFFYR
jgi:hypothetical protein